MRLKQFFPLKVSEVPYFFFFFFTSVLTELLLSLLIYKFSMYSLRTLYLSRAENWSVTNPIYAIIVLLKPYWLKKSY